MLNGESERLDGDFVAFDALAGVLGEVAALGGLCAALVALRVA